MTVLAAHLFLQLVVILACCRLLGTVLRRLGQTQVVADMVAGFLLGPNLLGLLAPLVFSMFLVGISFDTSIFRNHSRQALYTSVSGVVVPIGFGGATARDLVKSTRSGGCGGGEFGEQVGLDLFQGRDPVVDLI